MVDADQGIKMDVLAESPDTKGVIISAHGMLPILEILETCSRRDVILRLLKVVNFVSGCYLGTTLLEHN